MALAETPVNKNASRIIIEMENAADRVVDALQVLQAAQQRYEWSNVQAWVDNTLPGEMVLHTAIEEGDVNDAIASMNALLALLDANSEAHWRGLSDFAERAK